MAGARIVLLRPHANPLGSGAGSPAPLLRHVLGGILRRERHRQGRTLSDVANRAGVSTQYLSEVERGRKEPSSEILAAVCTALGGRLVDLLGAAHLELSSTGNRGDAALSFTQPQPAQPQPLQSQGQQPQPAQPQQGQLQLLAA